MTNSKATKVISLILTITLLFSINMVPLNTAFALDEPITETSSEQGLPDSSPDQSQFESENSESPADEIPTESEDSESLADELPAESENSESPADETPTEPKNSESSDKTPEESTQMPVDISNSVLIESSSKLAIDKNIDLKSEEIIQERTEYSKTFKLENGQYEAVIYGLPIHYLEDGIYKNIDNSLSLASNRDGGKTFTNCRSDVKAEISSNSGVASLTKGKYYIEWSIEGFNKSRNEGELKAGLCTSDWKQMRAGDRRHNIPNYASEVNYKEVLPGIDLQCLVIANGIKENIILNQKSDITTIVQKINAPGLTLSVNKDGSINCVDKKTEEIVFFLPAPYMYDSKDEIFDEIKVTLKESRDGYILTYSLDKEWLEKATYPVTVDPTVWADDGRDNVIDNRINEGYSTKNYKSSYVMCTGYGSSSHTNYSLIKFVNLPVDGNCIINSATLKVKMNYDASVSSTVGTHKITSDWNQTVTWSSKPTFDTNPTSLLTVAKTQNVVYSFPIKSIFEYWQSGHNYGVLLKDTSSNSCYKQWATWNATYGPGPQLSVVYTDSTAPGNPNVTATITDTAKNVGDNIPVRISFPSVTDPGYPNGTGTGVKEYKISCNDSSVATVTKSASAGTIFQDYTLKDNKSYTFTVKSIDNVGNTSSGTQKTVQTPDRTGPVMSTPTITDVDGNPITSFTTITNIKVNWSLSDQGNGMDAGGKVYYGIFKDGVAVEDYQYISTSAYSGSIPLYFSSKPDGEYQIRLYGVDHTGNGLASSYKFVTYKKDTSIDNISVTLLPGDYTDNNKVTKSTITVVSSADDNQTFSEWRLDIRPGADPYFDDTCPPLISGNNVNVLNNQYSLDLSSYTNGFYTIRLKITDTSNNEYEALCTFTKVCNGTPAQIGIYEPSGNMITENELDSENSLEIILDGSFRLYKTLYINNAVVEQTVGHIFNVDITENVNGDPKYREDENISVYIRSNDTYYPSLPTDDTFSSYTDNISLITDDFTNVDSTYTLNNIMYSGDEIRLDYCKTSGYIQTQFVNLEGCIAYLELGVEEDTWTGAHIKYYICDSSEEWIEIQPNTRVYAPDIVGCIRLKAEFTGPGLFSSPELDSWQLDATMIYYKDTMEYNYQFTELENGLRGLDNVEKDNDDGSHAIQLKAATHYPQTIMYYPSGSFRTAEKILPAEATKVCLSTTATNEDHITYKVSANGGDDWQEITPSSDGTPTILNWPGNELCMEVVMDSGNNHDIQPSIDSMNLQVYQNILGDKILNVRLIDPPHNLSAYPQINYKTLLRWDPSETEDVTYNIYRSKTRYFEPWDVEPIATGITETSWSDFNLDYGETYYYLVTAVKKYGDNVRESTPTSDAYAKIVDEDELQKHLGLQSYWTFTSFRTGGGTGYVNVTNGNVVYTATDLIVTGPSLATVMRRTYNSLSSSRSSLGDGWDYSFNTCLLIEYQSDGVTEKGLILKDGDGSIHTFKKSTTNPNKYLPDEKIYMEIDKISKTDEEGNTYYEYELKRKDSIKYYFDKNLRLKSFSEPNGNKLILHYDDRGNVEKVTNSVNDSMYLIYDATDRLMAVTDGTPVYNENHEVTDITGGRTIVYEQVSPDDPRDVQLKSVAFNKGSWAEPNLAHKESYSYTPLLNTITDPEDNVTDLDFAYSSANSCHQISKVTLPNSQMFEYTYEADDINTAIYDAKTTVTDTLNGNSSVITYTYNQQGQTTKYTDPNNKSIVYEYNCPTDSYLPSTMTFQNRTGDGLVLKNIISSYEYDSNGNITSVKQESQVASNPSDTTLLAETKYLQYNSFNKPKYIKVRNNKNTATYNTTEYQYDGYGNVIKVVDPKGRETNNTYYYTNDTDAYRIGMLESTTDCYGKKTTYTYDSKGRLIETKVWDKANQLISTAEVSDYDDYNQPMLITDEMGNMTYYQYDELGMMESMVKKNSGNNTLLEESFSYDENYNLKYHENGLGTELQKTWYNYDELDRVIETKQLVGVDGATEIKNTQTVSYNRNSSGDYVTTTAVYPDSSDNQVSVSYFDKAGLPLKTVVNGITMVENTEFDDIGNVLTTKITMDEPTSKYRYDKTYYDDYGRQFKSIVDYGGLNITNSVTYDFLGYQKTTTDAEGNVTSYDYDVLGRIESVTTPTNDVTQYEYDIISSNQYGNKVIDAENNVSYTWFDSIGRKVKTTREGIVTSTLVYGDPNSSNTNLKGYSTMVKEMTTKDTISDSINDEVTQKYDYDDLGRVEKLTYYNGTIEGDHISYEYDGLGQLDTSKLFNSQNVLKSSTSNSYDRLGRVIQRSENGLTISYLYEDGYNLTLLRYDNGQVIDGDVCVKSLQYEYDDFGRLEYVKFDETGTPNTFGSFLPVRKYVYYTDGSVNSIEDYREFDQTGAKILRDYGYDTAGRLDIMTYTDSTDNATTHKKETHDIDYYLNGLVESEVITNQFTGVNEKVIDKSYQYYDNGMLHTSNTSIIDGSSTKNTTETYTYDGIGNRTGFTIAKTDCPTQYFENYNYNDLNQLLSVQRRIGTSYVLKNTYVYDGRGNQIAQEENGYVSGTKPTDLPEEITVDNITTNYTYDFANQLSTVAVAYPNAFPSRSLVQTNSYNAAGQRIKRVEEDHQKDPYHANDPSCDTIVNSTSKYYYSGSKILFSTNDDIYGYETENILTPGGTIVASQRFEAPYNNEFLFYNYDLRGSTTNLIDPDTGLSVKNYTYDAFGNTVESQDTVQNDVQYTGAVSDRNTGLYNMNARYYQPATGRFLSQDTYIGSAYEPWTQHLYSYTGNNPVNFVDPTGHRRVDIGPNDFQDAWRSGESLVPDTEGLSRKERLFVEGKISNKKGSYMPDGGVDTNRYLVDQAMWVREVQISITFYTPEQAQAEYVTRLQGCTGNDWVDLGLLAGGGAALFGGVSTALPPLGIVLWGIGGFRILNKEIDEIQLNNFEKAMTNGVGYVEALEGEGFVGVVEVTTALEGDKRCEGSSTIYYPWDGSTRYGDYPYAITNPYGGCIIEEYTPYQNYRGR